MPSVGAGIATGVLVGAGNGLLVTRLQVVPFIVTLGTMGIARGMAKYLADEQKIDAPVLAGDRDGQGADAVVAASSPPAPGSCSGSRC